MSELVSKYPTAGGIYWWAAKLGGPVWGWFTGWFNLIGLVGVVASVQYACATFMNALFGYFELNFIVNFADDKHILGETFLIFAVILFVSALINIFNTHLLALVNSVSVGVHVLGVAVIIGILVVVPDNHQSIDFVFTERINNSGFGNAGMYWFYVLPLGFLLTQYTITGFDASAHISEETKGASMSAAKGVWRSIFYSALIGWFVLLAITFAATDVGAVNEGGGGSLAIFDSALTLTATKVIVAISTFGQLFCGVACLTSASRMCFAFSRDKGLPGSARLCKVNKRRRAGGRRDHHGHRRAADHAARARGRRRLPVRVLRGGLDHRDRPLHRLRDPDLPALADGRRVRARAVDQRQEVQVDEPVRHDLGRDHHRDLLPAVHPGRGARGTTRSTGRP